MEQKKTDRRVKYTKMVIRESFLSLLTDKPITQITVKEICQKSDINRATFYSHYEDVYDLLDQIENEFYDSLMETINANKSTLNSVAVPNDILQTIYKYGDLCTVILGKHGDKAFLRKLINLGYIDALSSWRSLFPNISHDELCLIYELIANGCIGLIQIWIEKGMTEHPEEIAEIIVSFTIAGLRGYNGLHDK